MADQLRQQIFRQYDVRGIVGRDLTAEVARALGRAYAAHLAGRGTAGAVAVGRDNRPSGSMLRDGLVAGLTESGFDVVDIGVVPTPLTYWALHHEPVVGGIQITGSHNPPEYNGFKISLGTGSMHGEAIQELYRLAVAGDFPSGSGSVRETSVVERYLDDVVTRVGPLSRPLRVVADYGNGAGALVGPQLLERLGARGDAPVRGERRHLPEPPSGSDRRREPDGPGRGRAAHRRRPGRRVRRRCRSHRAGGRPGRDHLGRPPAHPVRARRAAADGAGAADHLRREVLAGAAAGDPGRGRRADHVEDRDTPSSRTR
jgi:hypothetical protein